MSRLIELVSKLSHRKGEPNERSALRKAAHTLAELAKQGDRSRDKSAVSESVSALHSSNLAHRKGSEAADAAGVVTADAKLAPQN